MWVLVLAALAAFVVADVATPNTQSAHNVYMEVLVDKYFDQTTSKLQVTGLEQMMTNLGLAGDCSGHGHLEQGVCVCDEGFISDTDGIQCIDEHEHEHEGETAEEHAAHTEDPVHTDSRRQASVPGDSHDHAEEELPCVGASSLLQMFGINASTGATEAQFTESIAPALIGMLDSKTCSVVTEADAHDHAHAHDEPVVHTNSKGQAYLGAMVATLIISLASIAGVLILPILMHFKRFSKFLLMALVGLAIGVLVGDSIMHLLPAVFGVHSHEVSETLAPTALFWRTICVVGGVYFLYFIETLLEMVGLGHAHSHDITPVQGSGMRRQSRHAADFISYDRPADGHAHHHGHVHGTPVNMQEASDSKTDLFQMQVDDDDEDLQQPSSEFSIPKFTGWRNVDNVVWLVTIGDTLHNTVDGITIGASFLVSNKVGIATAVAVFLHELPQEFGDFGILISAGTGKLRAVLLNLASGLSALIGVVIGIEAGTAANNWILAFSAGMFLYIALGTMLPQLNEDTLFSADYPKISRLVQHGFFFVGWGLMALISIQELHEEH